jgi:hypothetical protein
VISPGIFLSKDANQSLFIGITILLPCILAGFKIPSVSIKTADAETAILARKQVGALS